MTECGCGSKESKIVKIEKGVAGVFIHYKCGECEQITQVKEMEDSKIAEARKAFEKAAEERPSRDQLTGSEALFGFIGWITTREEKVVASASDDAGVWASLVDEFCKSNQLKEPREGWEKLFTHPKEKVLV